MEINYKEEYERANKIIANLLTVKGVTLRAFDWMQRAWRAEGVIRQIAPYWHQTIGFGSSPELHKLNEEIQAIAKGEI